MRLLVFVLTTAAGLAQSLRHPLRAIDFYGSAPVDFDRIRAAFPFQPGSFYEPVRETRLRDMPAGIRRLVGRNRFAVAPVMLGQPPGWVLYVGIESPDSGTVQWKREPSGPERLPAEITALYERSMDRLSQGGLAAGDETENGYSLSRDPALRALQLQLLTYARSEPSLVFRVLTRSGSRRDRIAAAWIAGYAPRGPGQLPALLNAVHDPDATVRNNAIRVLAVLADHDAALAREIPVQPFLPLLNSLHWTDRNKAMFVLGPLTAARGPATLASLRREALPALRQMSQWSDPGHADLALTLLGRACGIPEERLRALINARDVAAVVSGPCP